MTVPPPYPLDDGEIEIHFEVRYAVGIEAERLRIEQATAIREVMVWLALKRSTDGQGHAE